MATQEQQETFLKALQQGAAYPHATGRIRLVETHISWVFLTGDYAYKVKKPVKLPFLDFSTLELRRHYCREELRLNRRLAAELYLDVVAIGGTPSAPRIGEDPAIEYAVWMVEFPSDALAGTRLVDDRIPRDAVRDLAGRLAAFHESLPPAPSEAVEAQLIENLDELEASLEAGDRSRVEPLRAWTEAQSRRLGHELRERERGGHIRECHGDLHLGNLVVIDDRIVPFDCLEFDAALRCIDVVNEVAFLLADFAFYERADLAFEFLSAYLESTGDYRGMRLLRYYMVYRALVRAKVKAIAAGQHGDPDATAASARYLEVAERLMQPVAPLLVVTHGLSGSGKTTVTSELIGRLRAVRVRSDVERKRLHGLAAEERSHAGLGEALYSQAATKATYGALEAVAGDALSSGTNIIVDATFLRRRDRDRFRELAARSGARCVVLHCQASEAVLRERVARRDSHSTDASEATLAVLEAQLDAREAIGADEPDVVAIDTARPVDFDALAARLIGMDD
jgi:aminoglycoside phosphotransferase family enzyme/predicted kinase